MMKKAIIGGLLIMLATVFTFAIKTNDTERLDTNERYKVIHINGHIIFKKSGTDMKRGDYYIPGTLLDFKTKDSRAAVIHKLKGRFVISGSTKGNVKVLPAANNISSRGGALINIIDLKNYFDGRVCILEKTKFQIGKESFPMNNSKFFYLRYIHNGEKINKRLEFEGDFLIFDKKEIFKVDGDPIAYEQKDMTLFYKTDGKSKKISTFTPIFPDMEDLKEEVSLLLEEIEAETVGKKKDEVAAHLTEFYGKVDVLDVNAWLEDEFGIK